MSASNKSSLPTKQQWTQKDLTPNEEDIDKEEQEWGCGILVKPEMVQAVQNAISKIRVPGYVWDSEKKDYIQVMVMPLWEVDHWTIGESDMKKLPLRVVQEAKDAHTCTIPKSNSSDIESQIAKNSG